MTFLNHGIVGIVRISDPPVVANRQIVASVGYNMPVEPVLRWNVRIDCVTENADAIGWIGPDGELTSRGRRRVLANGSLIIDGIPRGYAGDYQCVATDTRGGRDTESITLKILS